MTSIWPTIINFLTVVGICVIPEARRLKALEIRAMDILSKDDLWQIVADVPTDYVPVYDANGKPRGKLKMRGLTGGELTDYQTSLTVQTRDGKSRTNMRRAMAKLVLICAINEDGSPYFSDGDLLKVDAMPSKTLMPMFEMAQKLCGLTDDDMKEMVEDFPVTQNAHSTSDLP